MGLFVHMPWLASTLLIAIGFAVLACLGQIVVRRSFPATDFITHNEVAGFIIAVVGVLYAVLLGFTTVIVWEQFSQAETIVQQETGVAQDVWRFAHAVPGAAGDHINRDIEKYADLMVTEEWPGMQNGGSSEAATHQLDTLVADVTSIAEPGGTIAILQGRLLERLAQLNDFRTQRLASNGTGVPGIMYFALICGGITVIGFEYVFGLENFPVQLLMTAATAVIIGLLFAVVVKLDYPFRGDVAISPDEWVTVHAEMTAPARPTH